MSDFAAARVAAQAAEVWRETHETGMAAWEGTPMSSREARYRLEFVEPTVKRIYGAYRNGELSIEGVRLAIDAALSPIPSRRRHFRRPGEMTEAAAIVHLHKLGIATRSTQQVASGAMPDLPHIGDVADDYGITIVDPDEEEVEMTDVESDLL